MDEMTACLQENMELYAENERLFQLVGKLKTKAKKRSRGLIAGNAKRKQDMLVLRNEKMWTLQEIADEYGLTRERIRQIVGNSGENKKLARRKKAAINALDMTNKEVAEALGVTEGTVVSYRVGFRHAISSGDSSIHIGIEKEEEWGDKLKSMGFDVRLMPHHYAFDALVNGWRVDFKYCKTQHTPPSMYNSPYPRWRFNVKKGEKKRNDCDFYFCITSNDDVFIIPSKKVPHTMSLLIFTYPRGKSGKSSKWQSYKDRYDLLQEVKS